MLNKGLFKKMISFCFHVINNSCIHITVIGVYVIFSCAVFNFSCFRFIYIDVGSNGRASDGGVWRDCDFNKLLENNMAGLPPAKPLTADEPPTPYAFVADEAFPLQPYLMKPHAR